MSDVLFYSVIGWFVCGLLTATWQQWTCARTSPKELWQDKWVILLYLVLGLLGLLLSVLMAWLLSRLHKSEEFNDFTDEIVGDNMKQQLQKLSERRDSH